MSLKTWEDVGHLSRENRIYNSLAASVGQISFLTYGTGDKAYESRIIPIKVLPKLRGIPIKLYSFVMPLVHWKALKETDFLMTNQMTGSWAAVIAKLLFRKKLIVRCGYEWELFAKKQKTSKLRLFLIHLIEWISYHVADAIILTSDEMKRYVCDTFEIPPEKITVIPNYIDTELFRPLADVKKMPGRLIFVGRLVEQKNLLSLFEAVKDLPDIELLLVGDGPLRKELEGYARAHGIRAVFQARVPNDQLPLFLNTAEAFVLPSLYEGNPKALLEAMACGLPVIVTPVAGNREVVIHRVNGYHSSNKSSEAIREAIVEVLSNINLEEGLAKQARLFVEHNCSLTVTIERELKLLSHLGQPV
jgi:glycosyltransferase involved in cell wall biosynthesis